MLSPFCTEALLVDAIVRPLDSNYYLLGNKVLDGKFEIWKNATTPRFWTPSLSGGSTVNQNGTYYKDGIYSLRLTVDGINSAVGAVQSVSLFPGWYYTLSLYRRNSAAGKTGKIILGDSGGNTYLQSDGTWDASGYISIPNSDRVWTVYSLTFKAANYTEYTLTLGNDSAASSNIYFDSLSLVEAPTGRPGAQFPQPAREAEIYCHDAAVYYGLGGNIPTAETGFILEPTGVDEKGLKVLKNFDEIRSFRAVRSGDFSALLMVNYKR